MHVRCGKRKARTTGACRGRLHLCIPAPDLPLLLCLLSRSADHRHCFFDDPALDWEAGTRLQDRVRVFDSEQHRKIRWEQSVESKGVKPQAPPPRCCKHGLPQRIYSLAAAPASQLKWCCRALRSARPACRYYRAYADTRDQNGHGTHVAGTLAGLRFGASVAEQAAAGANSSLGLAPEAKLAVYGAHAGLLLLLHMPA